MSYSDKNKIFFGLLHYIFSEQSNVDWAFKTSLVNFTGINENVSQRKYKNDSISNDIIKYVRDIKPYHVQFDHYIEKFTSKDDVAKIIPSDSIFPTINVRYDAVSTTPDIEDYLYTSGYSEKIDTITYKKGKFKNINFSLTQYLDDDNNKQWGYAGIIDFDTNYHLPLIIKHNFGHKVNVRKKIYETFSEDWGDCTNCKFTVAPNEDRKDWLYTGSLHFENGTLPIIVRPIITTSEETIPGNFTNEYGDFTNCLVTVTSTEDRKDWLYTISVHLENGTLPIIIRHDESSPEIHYESFTSETNPRFNGAYYNKSSRLWISTVAYDEKGWMEWLNNSGKNEGNMSYSTAYSMNWDNSKMPNGHSSVNTDSFYGVITNDGKTLTIYNEDNEVFLTLNQDITIIKSNLDFEEPEINLSYFSNEVDSRFNGGYYNKSKRSWLNAIADDGTDWMEWLNAHNQNLGNMAYYTATVWNWDNGKTFHGHPSVTTTSLSGEIITTTDNSKLVIKKENGEILKEYIIYEYQMVEDWDDTSANPEQAPDPIYNLENFEKTNTNYNSATLINGDWILTNASMNDNNIIYERNGETKNTITNNKILSYEHPSWDYGISNDYTTNTYYGKISDDGLTLSIYTSNNILFKEYNIEEFSEKNIKTTYKVSFNDKSLDIGTKYYNYLDSTIYKLTKDRHGIKQWIYDSVPVVGKLYYFKKSDSVKIYENRYDPDYKENILDFYDLTRKQLQSFEDTSMANRLFLYKTHNLDLIKDYLNAHFKGITVDGGDFNIDRFGYDAFLYDLKRYEEPTKTITYCLIDPTFTQIPVGTNTFVINSSAQYDKSSIKVVSSVNGTIDDYSLDNNQITIFYNTVKDESITIYKKNNNSIIQKYITNYFTESNDENHKRYFYNVNNKDSLGNYVLDIPESEFPINKIIVQVEKSTGYRYPVTNYTLKDKKIYLSLSNINVSKINWKIFISITDYSSIYDKIYTWEDKYGISNNITAWKNYYENSGLIQNINGNELLNPHYEKERPSELTVIYPQNNVFTYMSKINASSNSFIAKRIFNFDFKNHQIYTSTPKTAKLLNNYKVGDNEIIASKDVFDKPYYDNDKLIPIKILINSEIIEFSDYKNNDDGTITLKKLRRGINGTFISEEHKENSIIYPFFNVNEREYNLTPSYYFIDNLNMKKFNINGKIPLLENVKVYKTNNINLLSDIDSYTKSFNISDNGIILPKYDNENNLIKRGYLFINSDKIEFDNIENNGTYYTISNFDMPIGKKYYSGTQIYSNKFIEVPSNEYEIISEKYDELKHIKKSKNHNYIVFNSAPKIGECIIIENHNENVFY